MTAGARRRAAAFGLFFSLAATFGCASANGAELGKPISLKLGERAAFDGDRIAVTFDSVTEDSRCPKNVQCIRAGTARVRLQVAAGSVDPTALDVGVPGEAIAGEFEISVERLDPYPISSRNNSNEYLIILAVRRR